MTGPGSSILQVLCVEGRMDRFAERAAVGLREFDQLQGRQFFRGVAGSTSVNDSRTSFHIEQILYRHMRVEWGLQKNQQPPRKA